MAGLTNDILISLRGGVKSGVDLQRELGASQPTMSRAITGLGTQIRRIGNGRSTRYGLPRALPNIGSSWPVFSVSERGRPNSIGRLHALARDQYWFDASHAPYNKVSDGLPIFLQDLRPQGFIGRTAPKRFPELDLPVRITDWNDDHVLIYLAKRGEDCVGNLLLGDEALQRYLMLIDLEPNYIKPKEREKKYSVLAEEALAGRAPGSSAGGEHAKFAAAVMTDHGIRHVLVKFSPAGADGAARRWSDLLLCEHEATEALTRIGISSSRSELLVGKARTFLEVERFDRTNRFGRIGVISLAAVADEFLGSRDNWSSAARALMTLGKVSTQDADTIRKAWTFGQLIANSDMHFGNLSFFFSLEKDLKLAPIYDMLPMLYAPTSGDELPARQFEPALPTSENLDIWDDMANIAERYWRTVAANKRVSPQFRKIAEMNARRVGRIRHTVATVS
jgi:HipA-like C-terminal domain